MQSRYVNMWEAEQSRAVLFFCTAWQVSEHTPRDLVYCILSRELLKLSAYVSLRTTH